MLEFPGCRRGCKSFTARSTMRCRKQSCSNWSLLHFDSRLQSLRGIIEY
jgi:hypothetical protein